MGKYFGTDGFRGEANKDLTVEHAYKVGRYIGWYFGRNKDHAQVVIGKDTRRSSYMLEYAYITRTDGFDCGIMISASHNPYYDNGIKVLDCNGHKMDAKVENLIEQYIDGEVDEIPFATKDEIGCATDYSVGRNRYLGYLMSMAPRRCVP